jgi:hypothetical protein
MHENLDCIFYRFSQLGLFLLVCEGENTATVLDYEVVKGSKAVFPRRFIFQTI